MRKMVLIGLALCLGVVWLSAAVQAQVAIQGQVVVGAPPIPVGVAPVWTPVTGVAGVFYAPNLGFDVFRYGSGYYSYYNGGWFRSSVFGVGWRPIQKVPMAFYGVPAPFFRTPPGWARGRKVGWGGAPGPPGQWKKTARGAPGFQGHPGNPGKFGGRPGHPGHGKPQKFEVLPGAGEEFHEGHGEGGGGGHGHGK